MLYYNITRVYQWNPRRSAASWLADRHGDGGSQKRERNGNRGSKPDESRRHERDFPEQQPLKGEQRPGDHIGQHLRRAAAGPQRHRADGKADHRGPPGVAAPAITAVSTPSQPEFGPSQPVMTSWGMTAAI